MKRYLVSIFLILLLGLFFPNTLRAQSVSVALTSEVESVTKGEMFKLRLRLSSLQEFKKMEGFLRYDDKLVRYVSSDDGILGGAGKLKINFESLLSDGYAEEYEEDYGVEEENPEAEETKRVFNLVFKALKPGKAVFSFVDGLKVYSATDEEMSVSLNSMELVIKEPREVSEISTLSDIRVEGRELSPKFSRNIFQYSVKIPEVSKKLVLTAIPTDEKAGIKIIGNDNLQLGDNLVKIEVTSEGGATSTYELLVRREGVEEVEDRTDKDGKVGEELGQVSGQLVEKEEPENQTLSLNENKESEGRNRKKIIFYGIMGGVGLMTFILLKLILKFLEKIEEVEKKK